MLFWPWRDCANEQTQTSRKLKMWWCFHQITGFMLHRCAPFASSHPLPNPFLCWHVCSFRRCSWSIQTNSHGADGLGFGWTFLGSTIWCHWMRHAIQSDFLGLHSLLNCVWLHEPSSCTQPKSVNLPSKLHDLIVATITTIRICSARLQSGAQRKRCHVIGAFEEDDN